MKKYIPGIYRVNEERLLKQAESAGKSDAIQVFEYENPGWTFHGKGVWVYEGDEVTMSVIGSSNYSYRSNRRDTECQLYLIPECDHMKKRLHQESQFLFD